MSKIKIVGLNLGNINHITSRTLPHEAKRKRIVGIMSAGLLNQVLERILGREIDHVTFARVGRIGHIGDYTSKRLVANRIGRRRHSRYFSSCRVIDDCVFSRCCRCCRCLISVGRFWRRLGYHRVVHIDVELMNHVSLSLFSSLCLSKISLVVVLSTIYHPFISLSISLSIEMY